mmetsp:Transcript_30136/g.52980  ORF Transcript_30136/g.52980 Transcript_30136/m.52980 type:complete len:271 (+) Transcript_30136:721-1533(+)
MPNLSPTPSAFVTASLIAHLRMRRMRLRALSSTLDTCFNSSGVKMPLSLSSLVFLVVFTTSQPTLACLLDAVSKTQFPSWAMLNSRSCGKSSMIGRPLCSLVTFGMMLWPSENPTTEPYSRRISSWPASLALASSKKWFERIFCCSDLHTNLIAACHCSGEGLQCLRFTPHRISGCCCRSRSSCCCRRCWFDSGVEAYITFPATSLNSLSVDAKSSFLAVAAGPSLERGPDPTRWILRRVCCGIPGRSRSFGLFLQCAEPKPEPESNKTR